jgi:hypothetical protein
VSPSSLDPAAMPASSAPVALATVLPLMSAHRDRRAAASVEPATEASSTDVEEPGIDEQMATAARLLRERAGDRAAELPHALGRVTLEAERLLGDGPTKVDPTAIDPATAVATAEHVLEVASLLGLIKDEAIVLGEALASDLGEIPVETLQRVAEAVVALGSAPRTVSGWGRPSAAESAEMVLDAAADDLRAARAAHAQVYDRFTDDIWLLPDALLRAGRKPWRVISRARLRAGLRVASRSGRVPGLINKAARDVIDVRAARERLASMGPLLTHHLAGIDRGPMIDVDDALAAVRAVRTLQAALGDALNSDRLQLLLLADAFRSDDVVGPARGLLAAVRAWAAEVDAAGGNDALGGSVPDLAAWATECARCLPSLREGIEAMAAIGAPAPTLSSLVETLLIREHLAELSVPARLGEDTIRTSSAS